MKRYLSFLLLAVLLCGCTGQGGHTAVEISVMEGEGFTVIENGLWIEPGADAVFLLELEPGLSVGATSYSGKASLSLRDGKTVLTLHAVRYPTRVSLSLTDRFAAVTYEPNGGAGESTTFLYPLDHHPRPNTERSIFTREGYTLTGWNTASDGTGQRIGLGSRAAASREGITLYAQWTPWNPQADFTYTIGEGVTITGYHGTGDVVCIPERIEGRDVTAIAHGAFQNVQAAELILPKNLRNVALGAFSGCAFEAVTLFDSIGSIANDSFRDCPRLRTLYINAEEAPAGYSQRKESLYADKAELLLAARGQKKLVCFGGCAMWYNLDAIQFETALGREYTVINMGLNGLVHSQLQMQLMLSLMEPGDLLFHAPELSSSAQLMTKPAMDHNDDLLWCGLENNYALVSLVDFQSIPGLLESFSGYLSRKTGICSYTDTYLDSQGRTYLDAWGGIPFERDVTMERLSDAVRLDPEAVLELPGLMDCYTRFQEKGIQVYGSFACTNLDALPEGERGNAAAVEEALHQALHGVRSISRLEDYLFRNQDFYDTNYHLRSEAARENTTRWLRDLMAAMEEDGL